MFSRKNAGEVHDVYCFAGEVHDVYCFAGEVHDAFIAGGLLQEVHDGECSHGFGDDGCS